MKSTGIVRKADELGRIVLPIEMRRTLGIGVKDPLEMFSDRGDQESFDVPEKIMVCNVMFQKLYHPFMVNRIEELTYITFSDIDNLFIMQCTPAE